MRVFAAIASLALAGATQTLDNPISKVIELLSGLQSKVTTEGEVEVKNFEEFAEWCEDEARNKQFEIKTGAGQVEDLNAAIEKHSADITSFETRIGELVSAVGTNEADLKAASAIRTKEHADFNEADGELAEGIDALSRAVGILKRMLDGGKSFVQMGSTAPITSALQAVVTASGINSADRTKLSALVQSMTSTDEDAPEGAPAAAVYESKSGSIVALLENMLEKAEAQRADSQKAEATARHNFEMLKQSLEDEIKHQKDELEATKKRKASAEESKAVAEGDLEKANASLAEDKKYLGELQHDCMVKATEHEVSVKERTEELHVLTTAKSIIQKATQGGGERVYSLTQLSFIQESSSSELMSRVAKRNQLVKLLRQLALEQHDSRLTQMALKLSHMVSHASLMQMSSDPFTKVKNMITEMVEKLEKEAASEASHKAYCDKEMSETKAKRSDLEGRIEDLSAKIDSADAAVDRLDGEIKTLQEELAELAKSQQEMDKMRVELHEAFVTAEADLQKGVEGLRMALKVLRDYYAAKDESTESEEALLQAPANSFMQHDKAGGSASGIIGMLEVAESDFARNLAEVRTNEDTQVEEHEKLTQENKVTKVTKDQDVKYKSQEKGSLEKAVSEHNGDRESVQTELDAVLEYWDSIKKQCIAKPETYAERKQRREAEIAGLKNALEILEGEAVAFLQKRA